MSRVLVWKCDVDGKLFEDEKKYKAHLRALAAERRHQKKLAITKAHRAEFIQKMCQVKSFSELEEFIKDNWSWFFYNGMDHSLFSSKKKYDSHEYVSVVFSDIMWCDHMKNSHHSPRNGVRNWTSNPRLPTGYPGWKCNMQIKVRTTQYTHRGKSYYHDGFGSAYFDNTPIGTGSGGGGASNDGVISYSYYCEIWADDFVVMREMRDKHKMWGHLGGEIPIEFT